MGENIRGSGQRVAAACAPVVQGAWNTHCISSVRRDCWLISYISLTILVPVSPYVLFPPSHYCTNTICSRSLKMTKISFKKCIVHTFSHGPVPALTGSLVCQHCGSIYHNNCSVLRSDESGSLERHYHPLDTPRFIQVASHQYVEASVILQWKNSMNVAWVSMMNCGRICDTTFSSLNVQLPDGRPYTTNLQSEHLFDAFIIISLLQDCKIRGTTLVVPHEGEQSERFRAAMEAQNRRIRMSGHEREHFCNKCIRVHNDSDGQRTYICS